MQNLIQQIEQWAEERNLINGSTPAKQMLKLMEEFGELCGGIAKNKPDVIKDSIGDCFVVLTILNKQLQLDDDLSFNWETKFHSPIEAQLKYTLRYLHELSWVIEKEYELVVLTDKEPYESYESYAFNEFITELNGYAAYYGFTAQECLEHAYNQIKDRKGKMIAGVFVKEEDL